MSSTKRGGQRSEADYYPTPAWCVHRLIAEALALPARTYPSWIEPCAGDGAIIRAVNSVMKPPDWTAVELREECREPLERLRIERVKIRDFFSTLEDRRYQVCITNPPFSLAMDFIKACIPIADHVIFLLRLNFLGSEERSDFIRQTMPDIYVLPNRPPFVKNAKGQWATDSIEYAWFHWHENSEGKYKILASTPIEERRPK